MSHKEHLSCYGVLSRIINPLLTKLVRSKWLDIGSRRRHNVKNTVPKRHDAYIARAHGDVYYAYESRLRVRLLRVPI